MEAPRRRAALFSLAATAGALAALPELASADLLAPDSAASDGAGSARTLYVIMAVVATLIVIAVLGGIARALRSRSVAAEGDDARRTRGTRSVQLRVGAGLGVFAVVLFVVGIIFTGKATEVDASAQRPDHDRRRRPAVGLALHLPGRRSVPGRLQRRSGLQLPGARRPGRHPDQPRDLLHRRPPPLVGAGARARRRRGAGRHQRGLLHRDRDRHLRGCLEAFLRPRLLDDADPRDRRRARRVRGVPAVASTASRRRAPRSRSGSRPAPRREWGSSRNDAAADRVPPRGRQRAGAARAEAAGSPSSPAPSTSRSAGCTSRPRCSSRAPPSPSS